MNIELTDTQWFELGMEAHNLGVTLSEYINRLLGGEPTETSVSEENSIEQVGLEIDLEEEEWLNLIMKAHDKNITLNDFIVYILQQAIDEHEQHLTSNQGEQNVA